MERAQIRNYDVFVGIDVGKASNYLVALNAEDNNPLISRSVAQEEPAISAALIEASSFGKPLVIVDQCGTFGRLTVAVAQDMGIEVAHISPRKFKQVAETYGEDKDDALDAFIIADSARSTPRLIDRISNRSEVAAIIKVLTSERDDNVAECTRCYNRLHDQIHQVCPPLEAVFSKEKLHNELELRLLEKYGGPLGFKKAGKKRCANWAGSLKYHCTDGPMKVDKIFDALAKQTMTLPAADMTELYIKKLAARIIELNKEIKELEAKINELAPQLPEVAILESMPGVGPVFAAVIASEIGDIARFKDSAHLATYAGLAPVRKKSGDSVNQKKKRKTGNRHLKNALYESANKGRHATKEPWMQEYYERKRSEGKTHKQAIHALARRRVDVVYAMLSNGTYYEPRTMKA